MLVNGFKPVFVDINLFNLSMNNEEVLKKINKKTLAVFITHAQGFNGFTDSLLKKLKEKKLHSLKMCVKVMEQNIKKNLAHMV